MRQRRRRENSARLCEIVREGTMNHIECITKEIKREKETKKGKEKIKLTKVQNKKGKNKNGDKHC